MATPGQMIEPTLRARLADGQLAGAWTLDPSRSTVHLQSKSMWGLAAVKGVFTELSGNGVLSPGGEASGTISVGTASIDTKMKKRDEHLRSAELLDSGNYPHIVFTAQRLTLTADGLTVGGTLQVRDRTRPLTFSVAASTAGEDAVQLDAEVIIDRSDFGLTWNQMGMASMQNTITISAVFVRS